jgi:hypothetical protein
MRVRNVPETPAPDIGRPAILQEKRWSMIRKSGNRFSEKIMLKQRDAIMMRFLVIPS